MTAVSHVWAEHAPIGVQLWPTLAPVDGPRFTLARVEIVRSASGTAVRWVYESGDVRHFALGEIVAVSAP